MNKTPNTNETPTTTTTALGPKRSALTLALICALAPLAAGAAAPGPAPEPSPMPAVAGEKADILLWIQDAEKKLLDLAAATPEAKFAWRPGKDVRSVGEVFMHVVSANLGLPRFAGVQPPAGYDPKTHEKSLTKKADIEKALKDSFAHAKKALADTPDAALNKPVDLFGNKTTARGVYLLVLSHAQEHLGQSIAYARMNKITPPWTERRNATAKAEPAKKTE
jgi:uncharacterized damage-inducible protein DinB